VVQEYHGSDCDKFGNTSERRREIWVHLGSPGRAGDKSGSAGNKSGSAGVNSGSAGDKVWERRQQVWERRRPASERRQQVWKHVKSQWSSLGKTSSLGMLQVCLEIIATTYRSTIVKTHVFRLYTHLCIYVSMYLRIYIATHLQMIYLDKLQAVLESFSRSA